MVRRCQIGGGFEITSSTVRCHARSFPAWVTYRLASKSMSSSSRAASWAAANNRGPPCHHVGTMLGLRHRRTSVDIAGTTGPRCRLAENGRERSQRRPNSIPAKPQPASQSFDARCVINFRASRRRLVSSLKYLGYAPYARPRPRGPTNLLRASLSNGFGELPDQPPTIESSFSRTYGMTSRPRRRSKETTLSPSFSPQPSGCRLRSASLSRSASATSIANRSTSLCHCLMSTWRR